MKLFATVACILALASCASFTAQSDFYVDNQSSYQMSVSWVRVDDHGTDSVIVSSGQKVLIAHAEMLEADQVRPSDYFESMDVALGVSPLSTPITTRTWTDNSEWNKVSASSGPDAYTLVLTDADNPN